MNCKRKRIRIAHSAFTLFVVFIGCRTEDYKRRADRQAYRILETAQEQVTGEASDFSIDTKYSERDPFSIESEEILQERKQEVDRSLDIEKVLDLAFEFSRDYQTRKEQLFLSALTLSGSEFVFDSQFFGGAAATRSLRSDDEEFGRLSSDFGFNRALMTGGSISAQLVNNAIRFYTGEPRKSVISTLTFNIAQPLLRGAGRRIAAENLKQATRDVIYETRLFNQFQHEFAVDILISYFQLLQRKDIIRNQYRNYQSRIESTRQLEALNEAGRQDIVELNQARQAELQSKIAYINNVANYQTQLDQFKIQLGLPVSERLHLADSGFVDLETRGLLPLRISAEEAFRIAIDNHPEVLNAIDRFEDRQRKLRLAVNNLKADLRIFADGSLQSEPPTDYADFDIGDAEFNYGVELDLPLNRLNERNQYRSELIRFEQEIRALGLALDQKRREIELGLRSLAQLEQNYRIQLSAEQIADLRVQSSKNRFEAGRSTERDIREALDAQIASQNSVTVALVDYLQARLDFALGMGILDTTESKFWLQRNPTTEALPEDALEDEPVSVEEIEIRAPSELFGS